VDLPAWKAVASHIAAALVALLFIVSGVWKITDPFQWAVMVEQLRVPFAFSMPLTLALGVGETFSGILVLVPRFRRWGAWLIGLLLVVFMIYIGWNYNTLLGKECSCFPWIKRSIGPGFFVGDVVMLAFAALAGWWAQRSHGVRTAAVVLGAVIAFSGASFLLAYSRQTGTKAPDTITVNGQPYSLREGRVFLYFYDPQCMHCDAAARDMAKFNWKNTRLVALPTRAEQFAEAFLKDTGFNAQTSLEAAKLKGIFPFGDPPFGVALENGRQKAPITRFEGSEPADTLRKLGFIE
jgi:uncharacterized membrane protein YphA (DoxX/SURF4 family)